MPPSSGARNLREMLLWEEAEEQNELEFPPSLDSSDSCAVDRKILFVLNISLMGR